MSKLKLLIITISLLFLIYIAIYFSPRNYKINYKINNINIHEEYVDGFIYLTADIGDDLFEYMYRSNYSTNRKIITKIDEYIDKDNHCLYFGIKNYDLIPVCKNKNEYIDFRLIKEEKFKNFLSNKYSNKNENVNKKINDNITINNYNNNVYGLWNYNGVIYVSNKEIKNIELLNEDCYHPNLNYQIDNYLIIPNYDQKYMFDEFNIINLKNGSVEKWQMDYKISYNSYYLGDIDNYIYLYDLKNEIEYKINVDRKRIVKLDNYVTYDNKFKNISKREVSNQKFNISKSFNYEYNNNSLYYVYNLKKLKTKIDEGNITIIREYNDMIYYLIDDALFEYSINHGINKLITNYEWKFNKTNQIYVYKITK